MSNKDDLLVPEAANVRRFAIAKLKRATSLPRMKDGRRPAMHKEGVSEGEKSGAATPVVEEAAKILSSRDHEVTPTDKEVQSAPKPAQAVDPPLTQLDTEPEPEPEPEPDGEPDAGPSSAVEDERGQRKSTSSKRRSRSRSRSRGSRDLRRAMKPPVSPAVSPPQSFTPRSEDSSQDEAPETTSLTSFEQPFDSQASQLQFLSRQHQLAAFMTPSPPPQFFPGYLPMSPPSLEALQARLGAGLSRSNSAAARLMAMQKLTGGTEPPDQSVQQAPPSAFLTRNNTVSGGERAERSVARNALFRKLSNRRNVDTDGTSGGEDVTTVKKQRRRSRRRSVGTSVIVDDRDPPSTSTSTPMTTETSLPTPAHPLPVPPLPIERQPSPSPSHISSSRTASTARRRSLERNRDSALAKLTGEDQFEYEHRITSSQRRLVVEADEDPETEPSGTHVGIHQNGNAVLHDILSLTNNPTVPMKQDELEPANGLPHSSDATSAISSDSNGSASHNVPLYLSDERQPSPYLQDFLPLSPWNTPMKARPSADDEEEVVYQDDTRNKRTAATEPIISWVEPEPEVRMPIDDGTDDDEEQEGTVSPQQREALDGEDAKDEADTTLTVPEDQSLLYGPAMPSIVIPETPPTERIFSQSTSTAHTTGNEADESSSSEFALGGYLEDHETPLTPANENVAFDLSDWEQVQNQYDLKSPRSGEDFSSSTIGNRWDTVKRVLSGKASRSSSVAGSIGRRSRSNSVVNRNHVESAASRESASSNTSAKLDMRERNLHHPQLSASESILSLHTTIPVKGGVSPIPPATPSDLLYMDSKLNPFPGIIDLQKESERKRRRGMSMSQSTPDVTSLISTSDTPCQPSTPQMTRDRKLSTQASDSRLQVKFQQQAIPIIPSSTLRPVPANNAIDYFPVGPHASNSRTTQAKVGKLPMDRQGVKHWLKKFVPSQGNSPTPPSSHASRFADRSQPVRRPSLSDVLRERKEGDLGNEWEELPNTPSREHKLDNGLSATLGSASYGLPVYEAKTIRPGINNNHYNPVQPVSPQMISYAHTSPRPNERSLGNGNGYEESAEPPLVQAYSESNHQAVPDVLSTNPSPDASMSETPSMSSFVSSISPPAPTAPQLPFQSSDLLDRFSSVLSTDQESNRIPLDPPRKLLSTSRVLQVVDANTVKHRVMFLFNDLLVLAKPLKAEGTPIDHNDGFLDDPIAVKIVVPLHSIRLNRAPAHQNDANAVQFHPAMRIFVREFRSNPDRAVANIMKGKEDTAALGCILFNATDLDKNVLGSYLSRRESKAVLKAYIDQFGFTGVRIDQALRVFWMSIRAPSLASCMEVLLSGFATKWFDANAQLVSFDRDLAMRLVSAIMQLNQALHPSNRFYGQYDPSTSVSSRDFVEAFRPFDPRNLVPDEMLENIHGAIQRENLSNAPDSKINFSPLVRLEMSPSFRLTYRVESEAITVRIPQPDSNFGIQLLGHGLLFNPPLLDFSTSAEASFRVTGLGLGLKTMIMSRVGPYAPYYSGIPFSRGLVVERAFMQNMFQLCIPSPASRAERKYMFSVDDNQRQVAAQLELQISEEKELRASKRLGSTRGILEKVPAAADAIAFKILQDSLLAEMPSKPTGHLLKRSLYQPAASRSGRDVVSLCCQNSLLPALLVQAATDGK